MLFYFYLLDHSPFSVYRATVLINCLQSLTFARKGVTERFYMSVKLAMLMML